MKRVLRWVAVGWLLALCSGCGAAAPSAAKAPEAPPPPAAVVVATPPPPPPAAPAADAAGASVPAPMTIAPTEERRERGGSTRARVDLLNAQRELEASAGNCSAACRALGSMDRAAGQVCALATSTDDARVCDDSKGKLTSARARVRASCGSCPNGPSVDPNAPVPSQ